MTPDGNCKTQLINLNQSQIERMQKMAATRLNHEPPLLNGFESQRLTTGVVEGFNNKAKLTVRKAYGGSTKLSKLGPKCL